MSADVAVIMGSSSDWSQMKHACDTLELLNITYHKQVISAHRMPQEMIEFGNDARVKGYKVIIAGAGGAAHLPGMIASTTTLPVIGVPIETSILKGMDSLLSIVQMPGGIPVATMSIGKSGAKNAALMAARILAISNQEIQVAIENMMQSQKETALEMSRDLK